MSEKFQQKVDEAEKQKKPADNMVTTKLLLFQSQMMSIQSAIENEQVTFEQYMGFLKKGIGHDKTLLQYFEDTGATSKANAVRFRIE
mmetsp:Transcript_32661/g.32024  ORF Transcript_32661/g.32024 Transcript_32661/m.32024 type:complete len:87 (+) Transcript_32661:1612-1872(+)